MAKNIERNESKKKCKAIFTKESVDWDAYKTSILSLLYDDANLTVAGDSI